MSTPGGFGNWLLIALMACAVQSRAQSTGTLRIICEPQGTSSFVLDGKHRMKEREVTLLEGPHRFTFWAPERRVLDTLLVVRPNTTTEARIQLRYSEEFIAYNKKLRRYQRDDRWLRYGTPALTVVSAAWLGASIYSLADARNDLRDLETAYGESTSPARIAEMKAADIPDANARFRQARTMTYVSGGVCVASAAAWWYVRQIRARRKPPVFDDKEKARFEGIAWVPGAQGNGVWAMGLTIPLR